MRFLKILLLTLFSCTAPDKASLRVSNETRSLNKAPVVLKAEAKVGPTYHRLEMRENNSFRYHTITPGTQRTVIYAGIFQRKGDSLTMNFHNNHKDSLWTGKAVFDKDGDRLTILSNTPSNHLHLYIIEVR